MGTGRTTLAIAEYSGNRVTVLIGDGDGGFRRGESFSVGVQPHQIASGDLDGDGRVDLATANDGDAFITLLLSSGWAEGGR